MASNTVINTNVLALSAHRNLGIVGNKQTKANNRLSSGKKINSAADDAAGLAISSKMKAQIRGLDMASKNAEDGISMVKTAEGAMEEINNMLTRMRELAIQSANATNTNADRANLELEVAQLKQEIDGIGTRTEFNTLQVLAKSGVKGNFQVGANKGQTIDINNYFKTAVTASGLGLKSATVASAGKASTAISLFDSAIKTLAARRANLGALQNRLEYTVKNLNVASENLSAANSRIEDADMAKEMMNLTSANVLQQAATSMLAQANQAPQSITQLLG